ncbi:MAG: nuclease-related domain-containing protein [Anaerolineaceae bacterium]
MKIITNQKLVKRNRKIGQITTFASMGVLGLGLYMSFSQNYVTLSFLALLVGFALSQIGIYFGSRWGRSPRPDEVISAALKGLDNKYTLYHYASPVNHLLVGPGGLWVISPYFQKGTITYDARKNRWQQKGGNVYMKVFAQEGIGRPDQEVKHMLDEMDRFLSKNLPEGKTPPAVRPALVFTDGKAVIQVENAPVPTLPIDKLKDFIRRHAKESPLSSETIAAVEEILPKEEIPAS